MSKGTPKPIYLWPKGADLATVKAAVLDLNLPTSVRPFWWEAGVPGPCIDLDGTFDHIHDSLTPKTPETLKLAILYALGEKELTRGPVLVLDKLKRGLGTDDITEIPDDGTGQ